MMFSRVIKAAAAKLDRKEPITLFNKSLLFDFFFGEFREATFSRTSDETFHASKRGRVR